MAELWVNDAGTARQIREVWVNDAGTARRIQEIWVNDNGTARQVFIGDLISIFDRTIVATTVNPGDATARWGLESDGDTVEQLNAVQSDIGDWITPKTNMANYEVRATLNSGTTPSGSSLGSWLVLNNTRSWQLLRTSIGLVQCQLFVEIRRASDGTVLDSATINLTAEVES